MGQVSNQSVRLVFLVLLVILTSYLFGLTIGIGAGDYPFARETSSPRETPLIFLFVLLLALILFRWTPTFLLSTVVIGAAALAMVATAKWQWDQHRWLALPTWATSPAIPTLSQDSNSETMSEDPPSLIQGWPTSEQVRAYEYNQFTSPSGARLWGSYEIDSLYSFRFAAGSVASETIDPDFSVNYHIGFDGWRTVPDPRPKVVLLGCSFTFGVGVEDDQNYAFHLTKHWPRYRISNRSQGGWGTTHAYLVLEDTFRKGERPTAVTYGYIQDHRRRNYIRRSWVESVRRPEYKFDYVELKPDGTIEIHRNVQYKSVTLADDSEETSQKEIAITAALIRAMHQKCEAQKIPFFVVALDVEHPLLEDPVLEILRDSAIPVIDARGISKDIFPHDPHPGPIWHDAVARKIAADPGLAFLANPITIPQESPK